MAGDFGLAGNFDKFEVAFVVCLSLVVGSNLVCKFIFSLDIFVLSSCLRDCVSLFKFVALSFVSLLL